MPRVKKGTHAIKNRRKTLKRAKGFKWGRSKKERQANEALVHAGWYAFRDRRKRKKDFRRLWNIRIDAAARTHGVSFSKLIGGLRKAQIGLNRKMLAQLAHEKPETFKKVVEETQK